MRDPIYEPRGEAREYAELALNIYEGCPHGCAYCYAPAVLRKTRDQFAQCHYRAGLIQALDRQLSCGDFSGRTVHLCFSCDPYPKDVDTSPTREVIWLLKEAGCHVQILTKNPHAALLDVDLLDGDDWLGTTVTGAGPDIEPGTRHEIVRLDALSVAKDAGIKTWVSCEPVIDDHAVYRAVIDCDFVDLWRFGKLNHGKPPVDYAAFCNNIELICRRHGRNFVIKQSLRKEMGGDARCRCTRDA